MSKRLNLIGHQAFVYHTSGIGRQTSILFSIDDKKRIGWYLFNESDKHFRIEESEDLDDNKTATYSVFGKPTESDIFHPRADLGVDQFVPSAGSQARALLSSEFIKGNVYIGLTVFLNSGPENILLGFSASNAPLHVRHHEQGSVHLAKVEPYTQANISSPFRIRPTTFVKKYKG